MSRDKKLSGQFAKLLQAREVQRWRYIQGHKLSAAANLIGLELRLKALQLKHSLQNSFNTSAATKTSPPSHSQNWENSDKNLLSSIFNTYAAKSFADIFTRLNRTRLSIDAWHEDSKSGTAQNSMKQLTRLVHTVKDETAQIKDRDSTTSLYDKILALQTPGLDSQKFESLADQVIDFHSRLKHKPAPNTQQSNSAADKKWHMSAEKQARLFEKILSAIGYDWDRGSTGETDHPATLGMHDDVRVGMRYDETDFLEGILTAFHEGGHALYRQGLPAAHKNSLAGQIAGVAMDEAMALLLENHVARSSEGAKWIYDMVCEIDPDKKDILTPDAIYQKATALSDKPLRTSADEIRYPLDVILRFRLEQEMFNTDFDFSALPKKWHDEFKALTGKSITNDNEGVLQDIHWFADEFGWFPNYMLGQLAAAQIFAAATNNIPQISSEISKGNIKPLINWLSDNIYKKGALHDSFTLIKEATGQDLSADSWINHIENRYFSPAAPDLVNKFKPKP